MGLSDLVVAGPGKFKYGVKRTHEGCDLEPLAKGKNNSKRKMIEMSEFPGFQPRGSGGLFPGRIPMPEVHTGPRDIIDCLEKIYNQLIPFCEGLRRHAEKRPDEKHWEIESLGPSHLRYWATYLEVVQVDAWNARLLTSSQDDETFVAAYVLCQDVYNQLKKCIDEVKPVLETYNLMLFYKDEILAISSLAESLIESVNRGKENIYKLVEKKYREGYSE